MPGTKANLIESFTRGVVESRYQNVYQTQGKVLYPLSHQRLSGRRKKVSKA
jgi:hypothetical protein